MEIRFLCLYSILQLTYEILYKISKPMAHEENEGKTDIGYKTGKIYAQNWTRVGRRMQFAIYTFILNIFIGKYTNGNEGGTPQMGFFLPRC